MNEDNKKKKYLFIIGLVALLLTVVGATYAYFAVTTVNNFGTSTINAQAGNIGTVTLNGNSAQLNMSLTALDMVQGNSDITYYASSSGKTTTPTEDVIGTASVSPTSDTNTYHCTYTLSVTHSGTNDMYTVFSGATNKSSGQIILTINGVDYDFNDGWPTSNQVSGSFYIKGTQTKNITAGLRIINDSEINQNYLANTDISISISLVNNSFSCTAVEDIALTYIQNLCESTTNCNAGTNMDGLVKITHDTTQVPNATAVEYRFRGSNPNNYVTFNNESWRIIGLFGDRIKLIRSSSIGNFSWDTGNVAFDTLNERTGFSQWGPSTYADNTSYEGADLMRELNGDYLDASISANKNWYNGYKNQKTGVFNKNYVLKSNAQSLIGDATWYLGAIQQNNSNHFSISEVYVMERGTTTCQEQGITGCYYYQGDSSTCDEVLRTTSWVGKVGLFYVSDWGYASGDPNCTNVNNVFESTWLYDPLCGNNWLSYAGWTITPSTNSNGRAWAGNSADGDYAVWRPYSVEPSVYLVSNVKMNITNPNDVTNAPGSVDNPYYFTLS